MNKSLEIISVVCMANYCRSPVAEYLLNDMYGSKYTFNSYGISPLFGVSMDKRSEKYLFDNNIRDIRHHPKKINASILKNSKLVLALDYEILSILNKMYPKSQKKIKALNYKNPQINLSDPYKMNDNDYNKIMCNIHDIVKGLDL